MSVEDCLDQLTNSVQAMQEMMMIQQTNQRQEDKDTRKMKRSQTEEKKNEGNQTNDGNESDTTIYQNILNKTPQKEEIRVDSEITFNETRMRDSTSSEDQINTSDELMDVDINEQFIAECATQAERKRGTKRPMHEEAEDWNDLRQNKPSRGEEMVKEAEASRARIFGTPGNCVEVENQGFINGLTLNEGGSPPVVQQYSSMVDENYLVIGAHLDGALQNKIMNNEYVDFARLIPR